MTIQKVKIIYMFNRLVFDKGDSSLEYNHFNIFFFFLNCVK
jgi:hypothetical protein